MLAVDVNQTLFGLDPIAARFAAVGLDRDEVPGWFAEVLRDGFAAAATDEVAAFAAVAHHHLRARGLDASAADHVLDGFGEVGAHDDVAAGLDAAAAAGLGVVAFTNGSVDIVRGFLDRTGLADRVEASYQAIDAGVWEPHPRAYRWLAERVGAEPATVAMVAVHPWDVHGGLAAGLAGGWLDRGGARTYPVFFRRPTASATTFDELVRALVGG